MDELLTYVYHIWNEWARGFVPEAVTTWFARKNWLLENQDLYREFVRRIGCNQCAYFLERSCTLTVKAEFEKTAVPCKYPEKL